MRRALLALALAGFCYNLPPMKPLVPVGCRDLALLCVCDANGANCHWQWVCIQ